MRVRVAAGLTEPTWLSPWLLSARTVQFMSEAWKCHPPHRNMGRAAPQRFLSQVGGGGGGGGGGAVSGLAAAAQCHPLAPEKQATCAWLDLQPTLGRESKSASSVAASKSHR